MAQISDVHIGGHVAASGERFSLALDEINAMGRQPDLVLLTGDLTADGTTEQWAELLDRLSALEAPWEAMPGNHDAGLDELAGHRSLRAGPMHLVLVDSANNVFSADDAQWLDVELTAHANERTVVAIHHPPFETGIWWMDCVGLAGADLFEEVVRRHPQVEQVLSGHVHRAIQTNWGACSLWVCPSTSVAVAADLDPTHDPAETAEGPTFSLHAYTDRGVVSHVVPAGTEARRNSINDAAPDFITWVTGQQADRVSLFS